MTSPLRVLHIEDNQTDAEMVRALLESEGLALDVVRVETREAVLAAMEEAGFDLIFCDFSLPSFDGKAALALARQQCPHVPFIFISGTIGEEAAIEALTRGATDYVLKQRIARLVPAVRRAIREAEERAVRRRTEEALRTLQHRFESVFESSTDAIAYTTSDLRLCLVNRALCEMTGYAREEILDQPYTILSPQEYHERTIAVGQRVLETGEAAEYEKEFLRKDGSRVPVALTVFRVASSDGTQAGLAAIIKNVTERRQLEAQLRQAQKLEAIGQLAGGIAHDFNNLLTIIRGYSQLLLESIPASDERRNEVRHILQASERAAALTGQLLAFSRRQVLQPKVLDLNAIVANVERMLQRMIGEDIRLVTSLQPSLGRVRADSGQIEQVLMNLIVNARDAMPQGGTVTIETDNIARNPDFAGNSASVRPGPHVTLRVRDTGCGMDEQTKARIFEPFFTTKEPGKGTGLGLSTVYGIVKQSGGSIQVDSAPGRGTTFTVYLPRVSDEAETSAVDGSGAAVPKGSETVLLVEDDEAIRSLARRILQTQGHSVLEALDAQGAIRLAETHPSTIHLLITDIVMPQMSGRELAKRLAALRPSMKVLYVSGYTDDAVIRHGISVHEVAFLQKPFSPDSLTRKVREVLDR